MSTSWDASTFLLAVWGVVLLVIGFILLKRGRWPRREGTEPHCRACDYLLIGIESDRCPECGAEIKKPRAVRIGHRTIRPTLAWGGVMVILLAMLALKPPVVATYESINWIHLEPEFLLVWQVKNGSSFAPCALGELQVRASRGKLSASSISKLVDLAIQEQAATTPGPLAQELIAFAQKQFVDGRLTELQKRRLLVQSIRLAMSTRPTVVIGNNAPYSVDQKCRVVSPWEVRITVGPTRIDGKQIYPGEDSPGGTMSGIGSGGSFGSSLPCKTLGRHEIQILVHVKVVQLRLPEIGSVRPPGEPEPSTYVGELDRTLTGTFEVVNPPATQPSSLIDDPSLHDAIKATIIPSNLKFGQVGSRIDGQIEIRSVPTNIAFDVFARIEGKEYRIGSVTQKSGTSVDAMISSPDLKTRPATIDIILRSNTKLMFNTIDQNDAWKGEIVYEKLPVK